MQYQLLPDLTDEEFAALKADIAARGVMVPVELDEQGNVLDGHHRLRACAELGITEWPSIIRTGLTEDEKREHVLALNLDRRHLTTEQRKDLSARLRADGWSLRRIAEKLHVDPVTVMRDTAGVANATPEGEAPSKVTGSDGKQYPARKPAVFAPTPKAAEKAQRVLEDHTPDPNSDALLSVADLQASARDEKRSAKREAAQEIADTVPVSDRLTLIEGNFRERMAEVADASVDLIFTDPPYDDAFSPTYAALAEQAARVLKPGGSLITYVGQNTLREVMNYMADHLRYWWIIAAHHKGGAARLAGKYVIVEWKPLLWYVKEHRRPDAEYLVDFVEFAKEAGEMKDQHDWQQQEAPGRYAIEHLTQPDDVVLDPFLGSGTTLVTALRLGRRGIGIELDPDTMKRAKVRLSEVQS